MQVTLVMTVIGKDRPGLVEMVAQIVADHGGNWLESRMCRLGGEFAGILRVQVPAEKESALTRALGDLASQGLTVVAHSDREAAAPRHERLVALEVVGQDRPGIVRQISRALARQGVNVEDFSSECLSAPMSGEILFKAQARLQVPASCNLAELRDELEKIAADLVVDISFEELPRK
jgi:glycine cleavage system regulatory protein